MDAIAFLQAFATDGPWVLTAIAVDRKGIETKTFGPETEQAARRWVEKFNGKRNLYFSVNVPLRNLNKKASKAEIKCVPWLHVDIDPCDDEPLEKGQGRIKRLLTDELDKRIPEPTVIVFSGGGFQAFWRLNNPIPIDGDLQAAEAAERYNKKLEEMLGGDNCHNIDRIMRLPDTQNIPDEKKRAKGREPALATVCSYKAENIYDLSEFIPASADFNECSESKEAVDASAVNRLDSLDDLDKWDVPSRIITVIEQGHDPENPKKDDNSRSVWLFDVCCNLVRFGVPDEVVLSVITDNRFKISDSVLDKGSKAFGYAKRQVKAAKKRVADEPPILSKHKPYNSAQVFIDRRRPTLMHYNDDWLAFDGVAYSELENETIRSEIYRFLDEAWDVFPFTPFIPTKARVNDVIDALKGLAHKPRDIFVPPCWLEGEGPSPFEIVVCRNGLLHLPTGTIHQLTSRFFTRNALNFEYEADAQAPERWFRFLEELWPNECDAVETLQEIFGYMLIPDTSQQKIFMLVGPARSGKGTIARVLTNLVGKHNTCAPTLKSMSGDFGLEPLIGKQLAIISDLRLGAKTDHASVAENLLRISGEDMVTANRKYKRAWDGKLAARFLIMTNELPRFTDASGALANRFVPLVMRKSFLGRENPSLLGEILPELPGILKWAIEGWRRLREREYFILPSSSQDAIQNLEDLASPEAAFIRDECEFDSDAVIAKVDIYAAWKRWCLGRDVFPVTMEIFSTRLQAAAHGRVETCKPRKEGKRVPSYRGIRLRDDIERELPF